MSTSNERGGETVKQPGTVLFPGGMPDRALSPGWRLPGGLG